MVLLVVGVVTEPHRASSVGHKTNRVHLSYVMLNPVKIIYIVFHKHVFACGRCCHRPQRSTSVGHKTNRRQKEHHHQASN